MIFVLKKKTEIGVWREAKIVFLIFGERKCSEPRDIIFALRSLTPTLMSVHPDYSLSTTEVFTLATRAIISTDQYLGVLSWTTRGGHSQWSLLEKEELPSWVPDWSCRLIIPLLDSSFEASKVLDFDKDLVMAHKEPCVLILRGILVDEIIFTTKQIRPGVSSDDEMVEHFQEAFPACDKQFINRHCAPALKLNEIIDDHQRLSGYPVPSFIKLKKFVDEMMIWDLEGLSFTTTKTQLKGFVLGQPEIGDLLFVAYGSKYPLILRQESSSKASYTLVGPAIIEGLMEGEAVDMLEAGKLVEETILLR